ncbi:MAG: PfkB family carbohydrate kinase [Thaumarchaeota archaeon]|nr:PfkB family carbohydrate kinase [Candidatus Geocrenenecus arthurdayi]
MVEVVCMGEILVDVIPVDASVYRDGMAFEIHFGGASANVAVGVARLGRTMTKRVKLRFAPNLEIEFTNREKVVRQMHELAEKG